jgi:hypothetical protein
VAATGAMTTFRVEVPHAVFSVSVVEGRVVGTAPIAGWMIGKPWERIQGWITRKGGSWMELES